MKLHGGTRTTHGGFSYLITGRLPEHRREVERYLTAARRGLIADLAGTEDRLTTAQLILIDRAVGKLGVLRCMEVYIRERSAFEGNDLAPCLRKSYLAYSNSLRLDLQALGVDRRAGDRVLSPLEVAAAIDAEKAGAKDDGADGGETGDEGGGAA